MSNGWGEGRLRTPPGGRYGPAGVERVHLSFRSLAWLLGLAGAVLAGLVLSGCTPHIGDKCTLNTDCSIQGTLACDNSQPNGYCTFFNCGPDSCQDKAACVMLHPSIPGCPYNDYNSPPRTGRTMCLAQCHQDSDCRTSDGYVCRDPSKAPWNAQILDDDQSQKVCIVNPDYPVGDGGVASYVEEDGGVCSPSGPPVPAIDAGIGIEDAGFDAAGDGGGLDAGLGASDGSSDGAADSGAADAPSGG
jgi:hypothetical protein